MSKKGFTLIELTISIALLSLVLLFAVRFLLIVRNDEDSISLATKLELNKMLVASKINKDIRLNGGIDSINCTSINFCDIKLGNGLERNLSISNDGLTLTYSDVDDDKVIFSRNSINDYQYILENTSINNFYKLKISVLNHNEYDTEIISTQSSGITFLAKLLELNPTRSTRTNFSSTFTTDNTETLYTTNNTEDGSTVYYFAGNALNNWVKFGKCSYPTSSTFHLCNEGDDLYWRIIRTNTNIEDGGVRLLYAGANSTENNSAVIASISGFSQAIYEPGNNYSQLDSMFVGYMWGTTGSLNNNRTNDIGDSLVLTYINMWYENVFKNENNLNSKDSENNFLDNYISKTAIYCNDRSIGNGVYDPDNIGSDNFYFGAYNRITNYSPSLACGSTTEGYGHYFESSSSIADKFTGSEMNHSGITIGNGLLSDAPSALITADEIMFAGGVTNSSGSTWYSNNSITDYRDGFIGSTPNMIWYTMSPHSSGGSYIPKMYCVEGYGSLTSCMVFFNFNSGGNGNHYPIYIRPVISLKANVLWKSGDGSPSNPYEVKLKK